MMMPRNTHGAVLSTAFTLALSFSLSAGAQAGKIPSQACPIRADGTAEKSIASFLVAKTSKPVFYELPADVLDGAEHTLDLAVTESGIGEVREELAFSADAEARFGQPVVEIFALHPDFRARLQQDRALEGALVSFSVDGVLRGEETFAALGRKSAEIEKDGRLAPVRIQSRHSEGKTGSMLSLTAALTPAGCVSQCDQTYNTCINGCVRRPQFCEDGCDTRYSNCLHTCGCPVVTSEWTTTTFVGYTQVNTPSVCLYEVINPPFNSGHYYLKYLKTFKNEHWQRIVNCDGVMTQVVASVDYTTQDCYKREATNPAVCYFASPGMDVFHACTF